MTLGRSWTPSRGMPLTHQAWGSPGAEGQSKAPGQGPKETPGSMQAQEKVGSDTSAGIARASYMTPMQQRVSATSHSSQKMEEHGTDLFHSSPPSSHAEHAPGSAAGSARISLLPWLVPPCMDPVGTGTEQVGRLENEGGWPGRGRERINEINHRGTRVQKLKVY